MPLGNDLFDTNAAVAWLADVGGLPQRYLGRDLAVSVVTAGELFYGVSKSRARRANREKLDGLLASVDVLPISAEIAERYGRVKATLHKLGKPIPDNDLWIAATAIEHGLTLVSRDKHFEHVPGVALQGW